MTLIRSVIFCIFWKKIKSVFRINSSILCIMQLRFEKHGSYVNRKFLSASRIYFIDFSRETCFLNISFLWKCCRVIKQNDINVDLFLTEKIEMDKDSMSNNFSINLHFSSFFSGFVFKRFVQMCHNSAKSWHEIHKWNIANTYTSSKLTLTW